MTEAAFLQLFIDWAESKGKLSERDFQAFIVEFELAGGRNQGEVQTRRNMKLE